jgi:hypothetical protein
MCKLIGKRTLEILIPFNEIIYQILRENLVVSGTLNYLSNILKIQLGKHYVDSEIFLTIVSRMTLDGMLFSGVNSKNSKVVKLYLDIISDLLHNGIRYHLNNFSESNSLFRTVDFSVDDDVILSWVIDLIDSLFICGLPMPMEGRRKKKNPHINDFLGETGVWSSTLGFFAETV